MVLATDDAPAGYSRQLRRIYLVGGATYPLHHLLAPATATDPWWPWWLIGGAFVGMGIASARWPVLEGRLAFFTPSFLVTVHLFLLATVNPTYPFYLVASVSVVIATLLFIRTQATLLLYSCLVVGLTALIWFAGIGDRQIFYLVVVSVLAALGFLRVAAYIAHEEIQERQAKSLEHKIERGSADLLEANRQLEYENRVRLQLEEEVRVAHRMEAVGHLAGVVAHEFNNKLMTIRVYVDLLAQQIADPELRGDVDCIRKVTEQGSELTRQILTLSRHAAATLSAVDLNEVVEAHLPVLEHLMPKDITVSCRLSEKRCVLRANPDLLEQVLVNLCLNARDAMPEGGAFAIETVTRSTEGLGLPGHFEPGGQAVVLAVTDTGVGIPREIRDRIFDPYFSTKSPQEGTGLGLSVVYGIVSQLGGHVRVESEPGQGARFEIFWPAVQGESAADGPVAVANAGEGRGGARILLVEDESMLRGGLGRALRTCGYSVVEAADGESALELIASSEEGFDLVATDVLMPGMDGITLLERVRVLRPGIKELVFSGHVGRASGRLRTIDPGVPLLRKPFGPEEMVAKIREVLEARADADGSGAVPERRTG